MKNSRTNKVVLLAKILVAGLVVVFGIWIVAFLIVPNFVSPDAFRAAFESSLNNAMQDSPPKDSIAGAPTSTINPFLEQLKGSEFSYRWQLGDVYAYEFSYRLGEEQKNPFVVQGECQYTIGDSRFLDVDRTVLGTGTAFVIAPGYLATSCHVVQIAERISFHLGERSYAARIVDIDRDNDLAILAYEGDIESVELAHSSSLELAESVWVFGYPMTAVIGSDIKVSAGLVSGINEKGGRRAVTIDGAIKPGYSGGPVVDRNGEVVGITSATLVGQRINSVGFASRVDGLKELMNKNGIPFKRSSSTGAMESQEIAKRIAPSVGLLEVSSGADERFQEIQYKAKYSGNWSSPTAIVNGNRVEGLYGELKISRLGEVRVQAKAKPLPYVLASIPELLFQSFDPVFRDKWTVFRSYEIQPQRQLGGPGQMMHAMIRDRLLGRQPVETQPAIPIELRLDFEVISVKEGVVRVKTTRHSQVLSDEPNMQLEVKGYGEWEFNTIQGVPISLEETLTVISSSEGKLNETPLSYKYIQIDPAIVAERVKLAKESAEKKRQEQEVESRQPNPALIDELIAVVNGTDTHASMNALSRLSKIALVGEKRRDVLKSVLAVIEDKEGVLHSQGWNAYRHWMDSSCASDLRQLINKRRMRDRSALEALAQLKLVEDVPLLLENISALSINAKKLIVSFGPEIESIVVERLHSEKDTFGRIYLLDILSDIGTEQSILSLSDLNVENDRVFSVRVDATIRAIQRRLSKPTF